MKTKYIITLFFMLILTTGVFSQKAFDYPVGYYSVGITGCTIQYDDANQVCKVYWDNGTGFTLLYYKEDLPNGNVVFDEYESNGKTYTGTFTFKNYEYGKGEYERAGGKKFKVRMQ